MTRSLPFGAIVALMPLTWLACGLDFEIDQAAFCRNRPDAPECLGSTGSAGASGAGGGGGVMSGAGGIGGSDGGTSGLGGGGSGGGGPCVSDGACATDEGAGSLCIGGACTEASATCSHTTLVVVAEGRDPGDAALEGACHYRELAPALAAVTADTKRFALYADAATAPAPLALGAGVAFDGHAANATKPVALTVSAPVADAPLVTLAAGTSLKGVALDGGGTAKGVAASTGSVTLAGPLTIKGATLALELTGDVKATVTGTEAAPVLLSGNARGVVVGSSAGLTLKGEGKAGAVVEGTTGGAGVLLERGKGAVVPTTLEGVKFQNNAFSGALPGTGAVEVRQSRQVALKSCVFEANRQSLTLAGDGDSDAGAFDGLTLTGNSFVAALPPSGGTAICGANLGSQTQLNVGVGNAFPGAVMCSAIAPAFGCNGGGVAGYSAPAGELVLKCLLLRARLRGMDRTRMGLKRPDVWGIVRPAMSSSWR
jgi:hypothetical protein